MCSFSISSLTHPFHYYHTRLQMVDVAVEEGGGTRGGTNSGEGRWGDVLEVATEVESGVVAVSLSLL